MIKEVIVGAIGLSFFRKIVSIPALFEDELLIATFIFVSVGFGIGSA